MTLPRIRRVAEGVRWALAVVGLSTLSIHGIDLLPASEVRASQPSLDELAQRLERHEEMLLRVNDAMNRFEQAFERMGSRPPYADGFQNYLERLHLRLSCVEEGKRLSSSGCVGR